MPEFEECEKCDGTGRRCVWHPSPEPNRDRGLVWGVRQKCPDCAGRGYAEVKSDA